MKSRSCEDNIFYIIVYYSNFKKLKNESVCAATDEDISFWVLKCDVSDV